MHFEMVGVQFHQTGHQVIAAKILPGLGRLALADLRDAALHRHHIATKHGIGGDDLGVLQNERPAHGRVSGSGARPS